jgi:hypothetical protein
MHNSATCGIGDDFAATFATGVLFTHEVDREA